MYHSFPCHYQQCNYADNGLTSVSFGVKETNANIQNDKNDKDGM